MHDKNELKRQKIDKIFQGKKPDAIVVLSADIIESPHRTEGYQSTSYADLDVRGLLGGGKARVLAAVEVAHYFPNARIITDSSDRDPSRNRPTHAKIYASEIERLGVPKDRLLLEEASINTITELVEIIKMASLHGWHHVAVISNDYQLRRIQEMLDQLPSLANPNDEDFIQALERFRQQKGEITPINAEEILLVRNPRYASLLKQVRASDAYRKRAEAEAQGVKDLQEGRYRGEPQS